MTRESVLVWIRDGLRLCFGTFRRTLITIGVVFIFMLIIDPSFRLAVYGVALDTLGIAFAILIATAILSAVTGKNLFFWPKRKKSSSNRH